MGEGALARLRVPEGHKVTRFGPLPEPCLVESEGGVLLAHLGVGSDDCDAELEDLARGVADAIQRRRRQVIVSEHRGPLHGLFAPSNPAVSTAPAVIAWVFHSGSVDTWAGRFDEVVARLRSASTGASPASRTYAYFVDRDSPRVVALASMLLDAEIAPLQAEDNGDLLVEVHRPEGVVVCAFLGGAVDTTGPSSSLPIDRPSAPTRSPRLRRMVLAASDADTDAAWRALMGELLRRPWPLLLIGNKTGAVSARRWPGHKPAVPAYLDQQTFGWAVNDMGVPAPIGIVSMPPRALFAQASQARLAVALNAYRERTAPIYLPLDAEQVEALARDELPPWSGRA
jgi:hypothetical protein